MSIVRVWSFGFIRGLKFASTNNKSDFPGMGKSKFLKSLLKKQTKNTTFQGS